MKAEIISIGTELLLGEITDTNASYLASQLPPLGIDLLWVSQVGDNQDRLVEVLKRAWQRSELILTTGGLGPTGDDLTREAIAEMLGEKMTVDPSLERALRERFGRTGAEMPVSNLKQATLIPSARAIPNANGTAPGWWVERGGRILAAMPGPPAEMQPMWQERVVLQLAQGSGTIILSRTIKTSGLSEAAVGELVAPMFSVANPALGIYAKTDGIHLRLAAKAESRQQAEQMLAESELKIRAKLGDYIWGTDNDTLGEVAGRLLVEKGLTLAVMEDYSGGSLASAISDIPESKTFFKGGLVASSVEAKLAFGVDAGLISRYGAVSPEVAKAMAEAARKLLKADIGISSTAAGESQDRPMGTTYLGISDGERSVAIARPRRKQHLVFSALFELRKWLLSRPVKRRVEVNKMGNAVSLGKLFGIEFRLHYSWFIIFVLVTTSLVAPHYSQWFYWVTGIAASLLLFGSVLVHELAHSLVGRANGIPVSSITLFIFGGVSLMTKEASRPGAELKMAIAGPVSSLVLGALFGLSLLIPGIPEPVFSLLQWLAITNGILAVFNLVPGFPLDGGRVFRSTLWFITGNYRRASLIAVRVGQGIGYSLILAGILIVFLQPFNLTWFDGLWMAFIGWFLESAARASYQQVLIQEALARTVGPIAFRPPDFPQDTDVK